MMPSSERLLHEQVCTYIKLQYPDALFRTDYAAGMRMTKGQAVRQRKVQAGRAWPDIMIAETWRGCGLFIELKREGTKLYKKDGSMVANIHFNEQAAMLEQLRKRGYEAEFCVGFEQAKKLIDDYLKEDL